MSSVVPVALATPGMISVHVPGFPATLHDSLGPWQG